MKKNNSRHRWMPSPASFVRSADYYYPTFLPTPPAEEQVSDRARKIFVIKETIRSFDSRSGQALPPTGGKAIRRILVFDDHPDSLSLVFGTRPNSHVHPKVPGRAGSRESILAWLLILSALILMFSPLLWRLRY